MRLINADRLAQELAVHVFSLESDLDMYLAGRVIGRIVAQPTAYDIDKVVEQLEKASTEEGAEWVRLQRRGTVGLIPKTDMHSYASSCYDRAIELVKGGGIDE